MKVVSLLNSVIQNYKEKRKEKKEERKWKESLEHKISDYFCGHHIQSIDVKIVKFTNLYTNYKFRYVLPIGSQYEKLQTFENKYLPKEIQEEIKNYFRYKKLKNIV